MLLVRVEGAMTGEPYHGRIGTTRVLARGKVQSREGLTHEEAGLMACEHSVKIDLLPALVTSYANRMSTPAWEGSDVVPIQICIESTTTAVI